MGHTAVLFVHGIGRHRRYANAGALLEALERVANDRLLGGRATIIEARTILEPSRSGRSDETVACLTVRHAHRRERGRVTPGICCRIYEVNWSPDTRGGIPVPSIIGWIAATITAALRRDSRNWLQRSRLRLARLHLLWAEVSEPGGRHVLTTLAATYRLFRGSLGAAFLRRRGGGERHARFADVLAFSEKRAATAVPPGALRRLALRWRDARLPAERRTRAAIFALLGGAVLTLLSGAAAWRMAERQIADGPGISTWAIGAALAFTALILSVFVGFVRTLASDVRYWAAVSENDLRHDIRRAVLARAVSTIRHILADTQCERLLIVSHSLGTAIAFEALRELGRFSRARGPDHPETVDLRRLDTLITMGSPIDKLTCLFESTDGETWREELLREQVAGDLSSPPFLSDGRPNVKWLNFWDRADPVSDPLFTPLGVETDGNRFVTATLENIEVVNTRFFDPGGSHVRYLRNLAVTLPIYREIFAQGKILPVPDQPGDAPSRSASFADLAIATSAFAALLLVLIAPPFTGRAWIVVSLLVLMAAPLLTRLVEFAWKGLKGLARQAPIGNQAGGTGGRA